MEGVVQGLRRVLERQLAKSETGVERPVEGNESEGGEADALATRVPRRRDDGFHQRRADAAAAMRGIDRQFAKVKEAGERAGDRIADGRVVRRDSDPYVVAREQAAQARDLGKRIVGDAGITVVAEQLGRAVLDAEQRRVVSPMAGADAIPRRNRRPRVGQSSKPSTMTISASATATRMALAAW